jgi:carotenoid cleavage dioxygenase-like enzyme
MLSHDPVSSRFLEGNFGPVHDERADDALEVIGAIPPALDGTFVRNGPNPQFQPLGGYHWFAGDGMLHGVTLRDGTARYRNRYVRTEGWVREREAGRALWRGDLAAPEFDNPHGPGRGNTANTALVRHHGKLLALWEAGAPHEIAVPSLETVGPCTFGGKLDSPFTAHPRVDPRTGQLCFFGYNLVAPPWLTYGEVAPDGRFAFAREVDLGGGSMIHDFVITARYAVVPVFPLAFDLERAMAGGDPFVWRPEQPTRFVVIERGRPDGAVRVCEGPACYVFHYADAHETEDGRIVVTGCRMPRVSLDFEGAGSELATGRLCRWTLDPRDGSVREEPLDDAPSEFPRVNEGMTGRGARFAYAAGIPDRFDFSHHDQLSDRWLKYDLHGGGRLAHAHGAEVFGGEGVFVPRPGARAEDDGWIVGFVHDRRADASELRIVDARSMDAEPVARVRLRRRVPYGFHGLWVPREPAGA